MRVTGLICAVRGHRWKVDDESNSDEIHLHCERCGAEERESPEMLEAESVTRAHSYGVSVGRLAELGVVRIADLSRSRRR